MSEWQPLLPLADIAADAPTDADDLVVVPGPHVYENVCPHAGTLLSEGTIEEGQLVCRAHGWRFDCKTGARVDEASPSLKAVPCEARGAMLHVKRDPKSVRAKPLRSMSELPGPRGLPIVGNALQVDLSRVHLVLEKWNEAYGPLFRFRLGNKEALVVGDPVQTEAIMRARPDGFRRMRNIADVLEGNGYFGVFTAEGAAWRKQRRLSMEALSQRHFTLFYPTLQRVLERFVGRMDKTKGQSTDIREDLMRFTVDVTTSLAFGTDMNTVEGTDEVLQRHLGVIFPVMNRRIFSPFQLWKIIKLPSDRRFDKALTALSRIFDDLVGAAQRRLDADAEKKPKNFVEAMLLATDEDGKPFNRATIDGNLLTMLLAGEDTTAYSIAFALHELCERPEVWQKMREEADSVFGDSAVPTSVEQISRLPYTDGVVQETLRLRPVAPLQAYEALQEHVVDGVRVPVGTTVYILMRPGMTSAPGFPDGKTFRPERWIEKKEAPASFTPFGSGPRICPGRSLALLEMRMMLATLAKHFELRRSGEVSSVRELFSFTVSPQNLRISFLRRNAQAAAA